MNATALKLDIRTPAAEPADDLRRIFDGQRDTALRLRKSTAAERIAKIRRLRDAVIARREQFVAVLHKDFGKPAAETDYAELLPVTMEANKAIRHLRAWMRPTGMWPSLLMVGTKGTIRYEPRGRCLILSPWNYPVNLSLGPVISAIAAGNTVILKPSEMTPNTSAVMAELLAEVFTPNEVAVCLGGPEVSQALLAMPFDHIFFTGSPAIGKLVMAAAAKHLTSVTLELGGKSPTIIDETADLDLAAANLAWSKFTNAGQTCIAPDHMYVHEAVKNRFVEALVARLQRAYGERAEQQSQSPDFARVVNDRHFQRVSHLLEDARQRGAKVLCGGAVEPDTRFIAPTLIENIPAEAEIMREEIFGPLLPIISFRSLDTVIAEINAQPKPLALYVFSRNKHNVEQVLSETSSGGACVNHSVVQVLHGKLPFGGVNNSGIGSSHGHFGFKAFSHERAVVRTRVMLASLFFPPYRPSFRKLLGAMLRML